MAEGFVLIVDDDDDIRASLEEVLIEEGHSVRTACNGSEALTLLQREPSACLILLDLMMPVMDGYEFRAEQRRIPELASIPVVVLTAGSRARAGELEVLAVEQKPVNMERLLRWVRVSCHAEK